MADRLHGLLPPAARPPVRLALVGIAVSALCESIIRYVMIDQQQSVGTALVWLTGSLAARRHVVGLAVPAVGRGAAPDHDALRAAARRARARRRPRVRPRRRASSGRGGSRCSSPCCSRARPSPSPARSRFIGLIAPHMARRLVGSRHAVLIPRRRASARCYCSSPTRSAAARTRRSSCRRVWSRPSSVLRTSSTCSRARL